MIVRNIWYRLIEAVLSICFCAVQMTVLARNFSTATVGTWAILTTILFFLIALSFSWGIVSVASRNISQGGDLRSVFWSSVAAQVSTSLLLGLCLLYATFSIPYFAAMRAPLLFVGLTYLVSTIPQSTELLLIYRKQMGRLAIAKIAANLTTTVFVVIAAFTQSGLELAYAGLAASFVVSAFLTYRFSESGSLFPPLWPARSTVLELLREAIPMVVMSLVTWLYVRIDVLMIDRMISTSAVGQYSAAYSLLDYLMILSGGVMSALFPNFAESASSSNPEFKRLYRQAILIFVRYFFPLAILTALFAEPLLTFIFGAEYAVGSPSLKILMLAALFAWLNGPSGTILISLRKQHVYMVGTCISLAVNVIGNLILIPRLGIVGAAWSTMLTELALCMFSLIIIKRTIGYLPLIDSVAQK